MEFEQKFIAFIDILGFKKLVEKAENKQELILDQLLEFTQLLNNTNDYKNILEYGPSICPESEKKQNHLNFVVTQISDCVVTSSEISPAGLINLISHSWVSTFKLMKKGIMCRGYITKGSIYHNGNQIIGSGYQNAFETENSKIQVFKKEEEETGTPFVEIDQRLKKYVDQQNDDCLKKTFNHYTKTTDGFTALFPFKQFSHISGAFVSSVGFEKEKSKNSTNLLRKIILDFKENVKYYVQNADQKAKRKAKYYIDFLDEQLDNLNRLDNDIDFLNSPFGQ